MILVTGASGQLGFDILRELNKRKISCKGLKRNDLDITDRTAVSSAFESIKPNAVIHCAAYNFVDKAEDDEERCNLVNIVGTENIALSCKKLGAKMMFFSSDYVFSGEKIGEYETADEKNPLSVYGRSKATAEEKIAEILDDFFILRISWLFGINGNNFVNSMLKLSESKSEINVVNDQIGSPTYTKDLAELVLYMIVTDKYGIYHATNEGVCSWCEFAKKIFEVSGKETAVIPVSSEKYDQKAKRPLNSKLSKKSLDSAGFDRLPCWEDALERYLKEVKRQI